MNRVIIAGNLGGDPESRPAKNSTIATFSVATSEHWTDANGQRQERTEWHRIVVFGKLAETCVKGITKGSKVLIEGRIQTNKWEDDHGVTQYRTEILASNVVFLAAGQQSERRPLSNRQPERQARTNMRAPATARARGW